MFAQRRNSVFPYVLSILLVTIVLAGVYAVIQSLWQPFNANWQHLSEYLLFQSIINTVWLVLLNALGCVVLGVSLAWLVSRYDFCGRFWFERLFILPLSIPPYVTAFIMFDIFDSAGHLNAGFNKLIGTNIHFDVTNLTFASLAMISVFYSYVYLLTKASLVNLQSNLIDSAKNLGLSEWNVFLKVVLPLSRPAIMSGASIVMMETLADFGTVSIFNLDTLTTLIYKSWLSLFDLNTALQLSAILLFVVVLGYLLEQRLGKNRIYQNVREDKGLPRKKLVGWYAWLATTLCVSVVFVTFIIPLISLLVLINFDQQVINWTQFTDSLWNTLSLGVAAACLLSFFSFILIVSYHQIRNTGSSKMALRVIKTYKLSSIGYIFPGSIVAVSILSLMVYINEFLAFFDLPYLLEYSVILLLLVYTIRFLAISNNSLSSATNCLSGNLPSIALNLGLSDWQIKRRVYLPNTKIAITSAMVLVFVEVIKEMPATLILRPYEWETLAVNIYGYTSEGEWSQAALPALTMVVLSLSFILILFRHK